MFKIVKFLRVLIVNKMFFKHWLLLIHDKLKSFITLTIHLNNYPWKKHVKTHYVKSKQTLTAEYSTLLVMDKKFYSIDSGLHYGATTLSITALSILAERCYAECHLCWLPSMLSVTYKDFMLSVIVPNVVMLIVVAPYIIFEWLPVSAKNCQRL